MLRATASNIVSVTITPDLNRLLTSTTIAFCNSLHALLDGDVHRAREVLKGSAARRRLNRAATDLVRAQTSVAAPQLSEQLQFVADISRVGDLVDRLARLVVSDEEAVSLSPAQRMEVAVLLDAGGRRLRQLVDGPVGPALDPAYRGCGAALFEVADHGAREVAAPMALCGALALVLLQASRHATRAA